MANLEMYIQKIEKQFAPLCTAKDLVNIGLIKSEAMAYHLRKNKRGPAFIKLNNRSILYPRDGVIQYLRENIDD